AIPQQEHNFFKRGVPGEVVDVDTLIDQLAFLTVNVADGRRGRNDTSQPSSHRASGRAVLSFVHFVRPLSFSNAKISEQYASDKRIIFPWLTYHANRLTAPRVQDCRRRIICRDDFQKARAANNTEKFALFVFGFAVI